MINTILTYLKNTLQRFSKLLIWVMSITITVLILIQLTIAGTILWLNSNDGQDFIKTQIASATQASGYEIAFTKISYAFPQGFSVRDLKIADQGGAIVDMDRVTLRPNLIGLGIRHFGLSLHADTLTLHRLPETKQEEEEKPDEPFALKPFSLPDIYFRSFALDDLSIKTLDIKQAAFGMPLTLSPTLSSRITLGEVINLNLNLNVEGSDTSPPPWMPETITIKGKFDPQSLDATLAKLTINNENLDINAKGAANLSENGKININADANLNNFQAFADGIEGTASLNASLGGTLNTLAIQANGNIAMPLLKQRGLNDITFNINDDNISAAPLGNAVIQTTYQDLPVKLAASFDKNEDIILIKPITGNAPDLDLSGEINLNTTTMLANGNIAINAPKLSTYSALANINLKGQAKANIALTSENQTQGASLNATITQAAYDSMSLKSADISAQIIDVKNPWPNTLTLNAKDIRPADDVRITTLKTTITENQNGNHALSITADGNAINDFAIKGGATLKGLKQSQIAAQNIDLTLSSQGSAIKLTGKADMNTINVALNTNNFNLASLPVSLPDQLRDLSLNANATATGSMNAPIIKATTELSPITLVKDAQIKIGATANYNNNRARIDITGSGDAIETLNGYAQLPFKLSLYPFVFDMPQTTPLQGQMNVRAQAKAIAAFALPVGHKLTGNIAADANIAGTIGNPDITGNASLSDGTYFFNAYGVELFDLNLNAALNPENVQITTLTANDGQGGQLDGNGRLSFKNTQNTQLDLNLTDFKLLDSDKAEGTMSANLNLQGQSEDYLLSGNVNLGEFNINIPERFQSTIPELNIVKKDDDQNDKDQLKTVNLDIKVKADDRIFVRGWGLDAEFGGNIDVDGTLDDPQLNGAFQSKRGRYEEFGRRFNLERAYLRFQGSTPPSPYLDILATTDADEIEASVNLSGEVGNPQIKLSSVPSLPEDEIMSHILFGENLSRITPFQAIQLKQTLDRFTGRGGNGFNPLGKLRDLTGLDDIRVDTDDEGEASVGVGKYLTEDVYLELEKGSGEASGTAKIQVEVAPSINLESKIGQDAQAGAGVTWKWDY